MLRETYAFYFCMYIQKNKEMTLFEYNFKKDDFFAFFTGTLLISRCMQDMQEFQSINLQDKDPSLIQRLNCKSPSDYHNLSHLNFSGN